MKKISILLIALLILGLAGCTIEKRHYMKGYHVEWKHKAPTLGGDIKTLIDEPTAIVTPSNEVDGACNSSSNFVEVASEAPAITASPQDTFIGNVEENTSVSGKRNSRENTTIVKKVTEIGNYSPSGSIQFERSSKSVVSEKTKSKTDEDLILLVILAILLPPLAMYLYEGSNWTSRCTLNLILSLLCWFPGVVHALVVILTGK
jgi:uncharacterized membrane protein YqaE (UPF0057 family)